MDVNTAVQVVLKKALSHDGLSRGLHEAARAIERGQAQLCVLADDCNQPDYKKLIEALCAEQGVNLIAVAEAKQLGQWAGEHCPLRPGGGELWPDGLGGLSAVVSSAIGSLRRHYASGAGQGSSNASRLRAPVPLRSGPPPAHRLCRSVQD